MPIRPLRAHAVFGPLAIAFLAFIALFPSLARATDTENQGIRVLPAPGKIMIDGDTSDWDLSGGIFSCPDAENLRDRFSAWFHMNYDADNLYVLVRFNDETPAQSTKDPRTEYGWNDDAIQFRIIVDPEGPKDRCSHFVAWRNVAGLETVECVYDRNFTGGFKGRNTLASGESKMAIKVWPNRKGYNQEIALPWKLITKDGVAPKAGDKLKVTIQPWWGNVGPFGMTVTDIFNPAVKADRVFTFSSWPCWGFAPLMPEGHVKPQPVRLSDNRTFEVHMENNQPVVDWTGLIKSKEPQGFKPITFKLEDDGFVSLNILDANGKVVRQLLTEAFYTRGEHTVNWDALDTSHPLYPGQPVAVGNYTSQILFHKGIGLRLDGYACGSPTAAPWDGGPGTGWGGDMGNPSGVSTQGDTVLLGWSASEAGKAVVCTDLSGKVKWRHKRGGFGGAGFTAIDNNVAFIADRNILYKLSADLGQPVVWTRNNAGDLPIAEIFDKSPGSADDLAGMSAAGGKLYISTVATKTSPAALIVLDAVSGNLLKSIPLHAPGNLCAVNDNLVYVVSSGNSVLAVNPTTGESKPLVANLSNATGVFATADKLFVATRAPDQQIQVFSLDGKPLSTIGRRGGRQLFGEWQSDGLFNVNCIAVTKAGHLWAAENDFFPARFSEWDIATGKLACEYFGGTHYGASGGAFLPSDPSVMFGMGCEWKVDPITGFARCVGVVDRALHSSAKFTRGSNGKSYLVVKIPHLFMSGPQDGLKIFERLGPAQYKLRATVFVTAGANPTTTFWADANDDQQVQPEETVVIPSTLTLAGYYGWSLFVADDLTLTPGDPANKRGLLLAPTRFTACNAPVYDPKNPVVTPAYAGGLLSPDHKQLLTLATDGLPVSWGWTVRCFETKTFTELWNYPSAWSSVHGSHEAPGPDNGLLRGVFGVIGSAHLPEPIGNVWAINTNCGEWHLFNEKGFYVSHLFQGDAVKMHFPEKAVPGAIMDNAPSGMGGEDFGGCMVQADNGAIMIQSGKVAYWSLHAIGFDTARSIAATPVTIDPTNVIKAAALRESILQAKTTAKSILVAHATPTFTGKLDADFPAASSVSFKKLDDAGVKAAIAIDATSLYLGFDVADKTPWVNSAGDPLYMYTGGDTVDFQLGTNPALAKDRTEAALGDLRLSIGDVKGSPAATVYRRVAKDKHPLEFNSGVVKKYVMESVTILSDARITVTKRDAGYTVEAAIPLASLDFKPAAGTAYRGDFGATHGDAAGRTRLRTYWNNQQTGIVDDAVYELMMTPAAWGELRF